MVSIYIPINKCVPRGTHLLYLKAHIQTTKSGSMLPKLKTSAVVCTDFAEVLRIGRAQSIFSAFVGVKQVG